MALEVNLRLPDDVYRRAAQYAKLQKQDIETALVAYLEQHLPEKGSIDSELPEEISGEIAAFHAMYTKLRADYEGEYVAIHEGQIVDHDRNRLALYTRVEQKYPDQFVLMRPVSSQPDREFRFRSPRLERRTV